MRSNRFPSGDDHHFYFGSFKAFSCNVNHKNESKFNIVTDYVHEFFERFIDLLQFD